MNTYAIDGLHFCGHGLGSELPEPEEGLTLLVRDTDNFFYTYTVERGEWGDCMFAPSCTVEWWLLKPAGVTK